MAQGQPRSDRTPLVVGVAAAVVLLLAVPVLTAPVGMGAMMMGPAAVGAVGAGWLPAVSGALVVLGGLLLLAWSVRRLGGAARADGDAPLEIVQRRYARGEIGREEYERLRADLLRDGADR